MRRTPVLLLAALVLAGGCRSLTGRSVGQWMDDAAITARVKARLAAERAVNLTRIHVDTYESTVYLTGGVPSVQVKQRAEVIARSVPQVALVVNNLHVIGAPAAASPPSEPGAVPTVLARAGALARLEPEGAQPGWTRYVGLDAAGRRVATVFVVPVSALTEQGVAGLSADAPVEHVGVYPDGPRAWIVLWHRTGISPASPPRPAGRGGRSEGPPGPRDGRAAEAQGTTSDARSLWEWVERDPPRRRAEGAPPR